MNLSDPSPTGQFIMRSLWEYSSIDGERGRRAETQRCAHARLGRQQASLEPKWLHSLFIEPGEQAFAIFICDIDLTVSDCQRTHPVTQWDEITTPQPRQPASQGPDSIKATRHTQTHINVFNNKHTFHMGLHTRTQRVKNHTWDPWMPSMQEKHFRHTHTHSHCRRAHERHWRYGWSTNQTRLTSFKCKITNVNV